jgi:hypothetical protein
VGAASSTEECIVEKFEDWLAPWERDKDGKKLDTPAEIDAGRLKKFLHGLLSDKEKAQQDRDDVQAELAQAKETLATVQRENETKEQAAAREAKEQADRFKKLEEQAAQRQVLDVALAVPGITAERARRLAKQLRGADEKELKAHADELIEDGFRIGDKQTEQQQSTSEVDDDLSIRPHVVRRADGTPVRETGKDKKSTAELLAEAIPVSSW